MGLEPFDKLRRALAKAISMGLRSGL